MSQEVFLVFRGEDGPESSPHFDSCFDTFEKARLRAEKIERFISARHMKNYPKGNICWHNVSHGGRGIYRYRASYIRFEKKNKKAVFGYDDNEFGDEVVYIKVAYVNEDEKITQ